MPMHHKVFISYASGDSGAADTIREFLEAHQTPCWMAPRDVPPGARYPEVLVTAIRWTRVFVLVYSSRSNASHHVARELELAASENKDILSVRLELTRPNNFLEYFLRTYQYIDASNLESILKRLLESIESLLLPYNFGNNLNRMNADAMLLKRHRVCFERSAFRLSCVKELSLKELSKAIDDTQAALNTGSLYSRDGHLLDRFLPSSFYKDETSLHSFRKVLSYLTNLKRMTHDLEQELMSSGFVEYHSHMRPYAQDLVNFKFDLSTTWRWMNCKKNVETSRKIIERMDSIDIIRNIMLEEINGLTRMLGEDDLLPLIEISSRFLERPSPPQEPAVRVPRERMHPPADA